MKMRVFNATNLAKKKVAKTTSEYSSSQDGQQKNAFHNSSCRQPKTFHRKYILREFKLFNTPYDSVPPWSGITSVQGDILCSFKKKQSRELDVAGAVYFVVLTKELPVWDTFDMKSSRVWVEGGLGLWDGR